MKHRIIVVFEEVWEDSRSGPLFHRPTTIDGRSIVMLWAAVRTQTEQDALDWICDIASEWAAG